MSFLGHASLCSNGENGIKDVRTGLVTNLVDEKASNNTAGSHLDVGDHAIRPGFGEEGSNGVPYNCWVADGSLHANVFRHASPLPSPVPLCRQFWKAGDYEAELARSPISQNGQNRLRVHPKFLHSNATAHKWAFGAVAELLDNAVDEVRSGATFVIVDKITDLRNGNAALLIQDDGGGMDPESLRHCMSFGFSDKQSDTSIGQYGNGFKTSTMRLGADVIVFSRSMDKRNITQSIGLLSYTFLRQTNYGDIIVPMVDYKFDPLAGVFEKLLRHGQSQFCSNLSTLLRWSPFATEAELLKQFDDIGRHGTKIIVFNLWLNEDGNMELDFDADMEDIMISGAPKIVQTKSFAKMLNQNHIANRFRYSLRVYSSILYLHLPKNFKIILRGRVVDPHQIVNDLKYRECIMYKPQVLDNIQPAIITTIGFLDGAPDLSIHGFNIYHKNRLILPFWPVIITANSKGRGVAGVLEVNFMKPTHDKQDFEKSNLYQKLVTRLKDMVLEYWDYHCHLVGYSTGKMTSAVPVPTAGPDHELPCQGTVSGTFHGMSPSHQIPFSGTHSKVRPAKETPGPGTTDISRAACFAGPSLDPAGNPPHHSAAIKVVTAPSTPTCLPLGQSSNSRVTCQTNPPKKRRHEYFVDAIEILKKLAVARNLATGHGNNQLQHIDWLKRMQELNTLMQENRKLQTQCLEFEKVEKQLLSKEQELRNELEEVKQTHKGLLAELNSMDEIKVGKL